MYIYTHTCQALSGDNANLKIDLRIWWIARAYLKICTCITQHEIVMTNNVSVTL